MHDKFQCGDLKKETTWEMQVQRGDFKDVGCDDMDWIKQY